MKAVEVISFLVTVFVAVAQADVVGWDTGGYYDQTATTCLEKKNSANFIVFNAMNGTKVYTELCNTIKAAESSGITHRDVKFRPCPTCSASAADQLAVLTDFLKNGCDSSWSHHLWLDLNSYSYWPTPWQPAGYTLNQKWFESLVDACVATKDVSCGIQSCPDQWKYTLGSSTYSYAPAVALPLWYVSLNDVQSFDDFVKFGGFTTPYAKQFKKYSEGTCGTSVLYEDWAPTY